VTATTPVDELGQLLDLTAELVDGVRDDQWAEPTPCTDWTVRQLVNHLVGGNRLFAAILRRELTLEPGAPPRPPTDNLGDDPPAAFRAAASAVLDAFRQPGVMEQAFTVPLGTVPGAVALHLRKTELLVHGWDLARATGQPLRFPEQLAQQELEFSRASLGSIPPDRTPFAPPTSVPDTAPAIDRLAALLGRTV
jgi:uncharacterized protein (TIGR03086 family)